METKYHFRSCSQFLVAQLCTKHLPVKFRRHEKPTKFEKNLPLSFYSVASKQVGFFFQILWPFKKIWTLPLLLLCTLYNVLLCTARNLLETRENPSIRDGVLRSGMLLYPQFKNKIFFHTAKFGNFKDEKISDFKTVSVSQRKNLLD